MDKKRAKSNINGTDIVVGLPSFNEEEEIGFVVRQVDKGLGLFPNKKSLIVNCDTGSIDNTKQIFNSTETKTPKLSLSTANNVTGKGNGINMLLKLAKKVKPKAIIMNDTDLRSISPSWVRSQIEPIMNGYDFGAPYYERYKYDGTVTNNICYPLIYGLFCRDIREPIGGDFAFKGKLAQTFLKAKWTKKTKSFGIDIFLTAQAILNDAKICNIYLGIKSHKPKDPGASLKPMFRQVADTLFKIILDNKDQLKTFKKIKPTPLLGKRTKVSVKPFKVDQKRIKVKVIEGFYEHENIIKKVLSRDDFNRLRAEIINKQISTSMQEWTRIMYDYILAYRKYEHASGIILRALTPLWFSRIYTFMDETKYMDTKKAEVVIKKQAHEFFKQRNYLLDRL